MRLRCGLVLAAMIVAAPAWCWGPKAHELITQKAIAILPAEMGTFYELNSRYIVPMSNLPDDWRESHKAEVGPMHYIDLDLLDEPPFAKLVVDRAEAEKRFGKEKLEKAGVLPWAIVERYKKLVEAMRAQDLAQIVVQSAVLAHFVEDAHVPFHATQFYDGKKPEQKGIHFRWEEALVELALKPDKVRPESPEPVTDPLKSAFGYCISSWKLVDPILAADDKAREIDPNHTYKYFNSLYADTGPILVGRLKSASEALAGLYVAAWKEAGKPTMPDKHAPLFWDVAPVTVTAQSAAPDTKPSGRATGDHPVWTGRPGGAGRTEGEARSRGEEHRGNRRGIGGGRGHIGEQGHLETTTLPLKRIAKLAPGAVARFEWEVDAKDEVERLAVCRVTGLDIDAGEKSFVLKFHPKLDKTNAKTPTGAR